MATIPAAELNAEGGAEDGKSHTDKLREIRTIDDVVLQSAPDLASAFLMCSVSHALGIAAQNAVAFQQSANVLANAVTVMCAATLLSEGAAAGVKTGLPKESPQEQSAVTPPSFSGLTSSGTVPSTSASDQLANLVTNLIKPAERDSLAFAPALAAANFYLAISQAMANAAHNATTAQQQMNVTAQAATVMGVATLYSIDTAATGIATKKILGQ